jgi:hypothetical protein
MMNDVEEVKRSQLFANAQNPFSLKNPRANNKNLVASFRINMVVQL